MAKQPKPTISKLQARQLLASQGDIASWMLESHQLELYNAMSSNTSSEYVLICSRRWGKSFLSLTIACEYAIRNPKSVVLIMAPTLKQGYDIVDGILRPHFKAPLSRLMKQAKSSLTWNFTNGSKLIIGTCERAHADSSRGGESPNMVIYEEGAAAVKSDDMEYVYKSVITPAIMRTDAIQIHCTTLSSEPSHFVHEVIIPKAQSNNAYYERDIYTNTSLTPEQIERTIQSLGGIHNEHCIRELLCKLIKSQSLAVFPEYTLEPKSYSLPEHYYVNIVGDLGGVKDKSVFVVAAYDYFTKKTYIIDERVYTSNTPTNIIRIGLDELESKYNTRIKFRYLDAPGQILVDLNLAGYPFMLPPKTDKSAAVNNARVALNNGELVIDSVNANFCHESCYNAQWSTTSKDTFARNAKFGHYDAVDSIIYAYRCSEFLKNINPNPALNKSSVWIGSNNLNKDNEALRDIAKQLKRTMS